MPTLSFDVCYDDAETIDALALRARKMDREVNGRRARSETDWRMDFTAVHASGNPLRLKDLLAADDFNFAHDAFGIARKLDRNTGQLTDFFSPRFTNQPLRRELENEAA